MTYRTRMYLKSIKLSGFLGVPPTPGRELALHDLKRIALLIGPNNAGKSILQRFLWMIRKHLKVGVLHTLPNEHFNRGSLWCQDTSLEVSSEITLSVGLSSRSDVVPRFSEINGGELQFSITIQKGKQAEWVLGVNPKVFDTQSRKWMDVYDNLMSNQNSCINDNATYTDSKLKTNWAAAFNAFLLQPNWYFFDTVRALDRSGKRDMDDGSKVLAELISWQQSEPQTVEWRKFNNQLMEGLNELFEPVGIPAVSHIELKPGGQSGPVMLLTFRVLPDIPVRIEHLGSGIQQAVILLTALLRNGNAPAVVFLEEPKLNLHPGLVRGVMKLFCTYDKVQFILTTHSNVFLDSENDDFCVYRFQQELSDGATVAKPCDAIVAKHELLDALGVSASTILQANCVIWVEGPTDRLYIRQWISEAEPRFVEGRDYSFALYGGTVLASYSLTTEGETDDFVAILNLCRFGAVVMDRDQAPDIPTENLWPRKRRILEQEQADSKHRCAILSDGWEVENDIETSVLKGAVAEYLKIDASRLDGLSLTGTRSYEVEIVQHLALSADDADAAKAKLNNKPELATRILKYRHDRKCSLGKPTYLPRLVEFIRSSQAHGRRQ